MGCQSWTLHTLAGSIKVIRLGAFPTVNQGGTRGVADKASESLNSHGEASGVGEELNPDGLDMIAARVPPAMHWQTPNSSKVTFLPSHSPGPQIGGIT